MMTRHIGRPAPLLILIATGIVSALLLGAEPYTTAQDDIYQQELSTGKDLLRRRNYEDAVKSFKRANEMRGKKSAECYYLMSEAYFSLGAYKNVIESADKVIEFAGENKQLTWNSYNNKGLALQTLAEKKDLKKLQAAEVAFRQALAIEGAAPVIRYNLGVTLLQLNRDAEGIAEIREYIKLQPTGTYTKAALKLADNPRRARENYAPDFSFTSSEGEHIALEDLRGKVVVLDFWATWCPPCLDSIPAIRNMYKKFSQEQSFVLIGISADSEDDLWREFTVKNKMIWPQYRDRDRRIQRAFHVSAFPTYVVIDHEGIVRFQSEGAGWESAVDLHQAIQKQVKIVANEAR
jgi:peroxiredoxin